MREGVKVKEQIRNKNKADIKEIGERHAEAEKTRERLQERWMWERQTQCWLLSAQVSSTKLLTLFFSTACHQCGPSPLKTCCERCTAQSCDIREAPCERFNTPSLTRPLNSIMSICISILPASIKPFLWWLSCLHNLSATVVSSAQLD